MIYSTKITSGPITKDKDGQLTNAFHFSMIQTWEKNQTDGEEKYTSNTDDEHWTIYPNGKFVYEVFSGTKGCYGWEEGTFDPSKYDEFVNQMKEYKKDWMKELSYDEETADYDYL